ncbi:MAG TPA: MOSC N-terminal beta barrel domain-containing protein, partial [Flavobacteriales bacterium]|nr:MOSC N-terminal beta barrel domain-containing protein [Flavobacteriales bacterium]
MSLRVASLHLHPIKSLGGFSVQEAHISDRGFTHDRRWMLVDGNGLFISQRELAAMACLHCSPLDHGFRVTDVRDGDAIYLPWAIEGEGTVARIWNDRVTVCHAPIGISAWFVEKLGVTCSLVFMPDIMQRKVDPRYANGITSLSDGFPYLIISQASLDDLNARMAHPLPMDRFRPNVVIAGGHAFQEDDWQEIIIGNTMPGGRQARFALVKPCGRCAITTTDQRTGERGKEPLRTLATYRRRAGT